MTTQSIRYISRVHLDRKMNTDMGKGDNSLIKNSNNLYSCISSSRCWRIRSTPLSVGYVLLLPSKEYNMEGWGTSDSMEENLTNTPQSGDKVNVKSDSHTDNRYP